MPDQITDKLVRVLTARNASFAGSVKKLIEIDRTQPRFICDPFLIRQIDEDRGIDVGVVASAVNRKQIPFVFENCSVRALLGSVATATRENRCTPSTSFAEATLDRPPLAVRLNSGAVVLLDGIKRLAARSDQDVLVKTAMVTERDLIERANDGRDQEFIVPIGRYRGRRKRVVALPRVGGGESSAPGVFFEYLAVRPAPDPRLRDAYVLNATLLKRLIWHLRPSNRGSILEALKSESFRFSNAGADLPSVATEISSLLEMTGAESEIDLSCIYCTADSPTGLVSAGERVEDFQIKSAATIDTYRRRIANEYAAAPNWLKDAPFFPNLVQNDLQAFSVSSGYKDYISRFGLGKTDLRSSELFLDHVQELLLRRDFHIILSRACYAADLIEYVDNQVHEAANGKPHLLVDAARAVESNWNSGRGVLRMKQATALALLYGIDVSSSQRHLLVHSAAIAWYQFRYGVFLADFVITEHMVEEFIHHLRLYREGAVYDGSPLWTEIFEGLAGEWFGTDVTASIARICGEGVGISMPLASEGAVATLLAALSAPFKAQFMARTAFRRRKPNRGAPRFLRPGM